ncbi:hypothetical protein FA15DRAFT_674606 [Coprinopsis marcescibilis]|uniref:Histone-lysine N-methyltransferase, H3 lysine-4 specific n=1 Tax=Coprinopsis marcescibilis TaxID=230819 RepID=A0A5C3KH13_COPMA|nr:hypothetical protein FA15DRAFT_674606 [Coprinopsis marcescibilis]
MSGKPPPTGPRALAGAGTSTSLSSSSSSLNGPTQALLQRPPPSAPASLSSKRIPTGPRSLHPQPRYPSLGPKTPYNGFSNNTSYSSSAGPSMTNGLHARDPQSSRYPSSSNGKKPEGANDSMQTRQSGSPQRPTLAKSTVETNINGPGPSSSIPELRSTISIAIPTTTAALPANRPSVQITLPSAHRGAPPPPDEPPPPPPPPSQPPPSQPPPPPPPPASLPSPPPPPSPALPSPTPPPPPVTRPASPPKTILNSSSVGIPAPPTEEPPSQPPPPPSTARPPSPRPPPPPAPAPAPASPPRTHRSRSPVRSRPIDLPPKPITTDRPSRPHSPPRASSSSHPRPRSRSRPPPHSSSRPRSRSPRSRSPRSPSPGRYIDRRPRYSSRWDRDRDWDRGRDRDRDRDYRRPYRSPPPRRDYPPSSRPSHRGPPSPYSRRDHPPIPPRSPEKEPEAPPPPSPPPPPKQETPQPTYLPLPSWPPPKEKFSEERTYKLLYDHSTDANFVHFIQGYSKPPSYYRGLIDYIKKNGPPEILQRRVQIKGKGKDVGLYRFEGEVIGPAEDGSIVEEEPVPRDPRQIPAVQELRSHRPPRFELHQVTYEPDENSTEKPPTTVVFANLSQLTSNSNLKRHVAQYGSVLSFEPKIDSIRGVAMGVVIVKFATHEEAKKCLEKEHGRRGGLTHMQKNEEWSVVWDEDGKVAAALVKHIELTRRAGSKPKPPYPNGISTSASSGPKPGGESTPQTPSTSAPPKYPPHRGSDLRYPQRSQHPHPSESKRSESRVTQVVEKVPAPIPLNLQRAKEEIKRPPEESTRSSDPARADSSSGGKGESSAGKEPSSDKPAEEKLKVPEKSEEEKAAERARITQELTAIGKEYVHVQILADADPYTVKESRIRTYFETYGIVPDKILRNYAGLYVTFVKPGSAIRACVLLSAPFNKDVPLIGTLRVKLSHHLPPSPPSDEPASLDQQKIIEIAREMIITELKATLERDLNQRYIYPEIVRVMSDEKALATKNEHAANAPVLPKVKPVNRGLKGLSFKKAKKKVEEVVVPKPVEEQLKENKVEEEDRAEPEEEVDSRPKKKMRKDAKKLRVVEDVESEDEIGQPAAQEEPSRKRATSEIQDEEAERPVKKKQKLEVEGKGKKASKKAKRGAVAVVVGDDEDEIVPLAVAKIIVKSDLESPSRSPSPSTLRPARALTPRPPTPPPDLVELGICEDEEDLYFAKLALMGYDPAAAAAAALEDEPEPAPEEPISYRKHLTGSARTEGFYKIDHKDKAAYVAQYQSKAKGAEVVDRTVVPVDEPLQQHVTSSRSNRANARRRAQGLEEMNQVQRAVALSKGETAASELSFKFNQLQTRKKHLRFARSSIHDWGLYAMERILKGEMVIEYVGEVIRAQVADKREKAYERQGIGSSYLFRIDEELVVDATKKGNLGRLINHSCDPNCTAKIITINGEKKIVIYAKQDIEYGDEITYDYHFPFEQDKIPCLCGSAKCRGYLN